jgi:hypothetical protein
VASLIQQLQDNTAATLPPRPCEGTCKTTGFVELVSFQPQ